jgi:hypothetical protein
MANIKDLSIKTRVLAPLGDAMHKGVIVKPPADHPCGTDNMVCVQFTPPVPDDRDSSIFFSYLSCDARRLEIDLGDLP